MSCCSSTKAITVVSRKRRRTSCLLAATAVLLGSSGLALPQPGTSGNPILPGWYADPEARVFNGEYWIFPTYSAPYDEQTFLDAFSSPDLVTWTKHTRVLDIANVTWAKRAVWAPSVVEKDGWFYLFFGANDIQNDGQRGGIGVARARRPGGPFEDYLGKPLIDRFHNGAQPIDQFVFRDRDGAFYIVYGGWRHCNIARLNDDFTGFVPFPDGALFKEITPEGYVEGAFMLLKDGKYYFMWSEGGWTGPNYAVAYAVGSSPFGPFERVGRILEQDRSVATGAGHHSVLRSPASGRYYIVYHRRPLGETDRNHRVVCIDELHFDADGFIVPVAITKSGVASDRLGAPSRFKVQGSRFKVQGSRFKVQGSRFRVQGSGFKVQGSGFRILSFGGRVDEKSLFTKFWMDESKTTRNVLARIPEGSDYRPDPKSRTAHEIAWQIVCEEKMIIDALESGKAEWAPPPMPATMKEVVEAYERQSAGMADRWRSLPAARWDGTLEFFGAARPASPMAWSFLFDIVHHRGQITTYLRPMGSTVPQIYGPSADEP